MKTNQIKPLVLFCIITFWSSLLSAQTTQPKSPISAPRNNDEKFVLKITDSTGRIRVAKMSSNDQMPISRSRIMEQRALRYNSINDSLRNKNKLNIPPLNLGDMKREK